MVCLMACNFALVSRSGILLILCFFMVFVLFLGLCPHSYAESRPDARHIFNLINERLGYMEQVALYKHQSHIPVEDLTREKFILDKSLLSATEQGLDSDSILDFFQSQMDAAKAVQYRYRADWLASPPEPPKEIDLNNEIRPKLTALGRELISSITRYLNNGQSFSTDQLKQFVDALKVHNLSLADKENIFRGLIQVKKLQTITE